MEEEVFKKVDGFEYYMVSNFGRVKSIKRTVIRCNGRPINKVERMMTNTTSFFGYATVYISKTRRPVHRLVALAFIDNPQNYPEVNHIDGNKLNNHYSNLEWCDRGMNIKHAYKLGLRIPMAGERHPLFGVTGENHPSYGRRGALHPCYGKVGKDAWRSMPIYQYDRNMNLVAEYESINQAAIINGFASAGNITACAKGRLKTYMGFIWRYKNQ